MNGPRGRIDCPTCGQTIVDMPVEEMMRFDGPESFGKAMATLIRAHHDTCTPLAPRLPKVMRRDRIMWHVRVWCVTTTFAVLAIGMGREDWVDGWIMACLLAVYVISEHFSTRTAYRNGYLRGRHSGIHHQRAVAARFLHPADGVNDPDDSFLRTDD